MSRFDCTVATISTQRPLGSGVDMCVQRERVAAAHISMLAAKASSGILNAFLSATRRQRRRRTMESRGILTSKSRGCLLKPILFIGIASAPKFTSKTPI
jgi:hypothetical protein